MGLFLASLLWAMEIRTAGTCPSASAIERRLGPLLGDSDPSPLPDVARLSRASDGGLILDLSEADGRSLGERRFPRQSCDEEAETVAVTLAVWEAQLHPEISLRLDRLGTGPAATAGPIPAGIPTPQELVSRSPAPAAWRSPLALSWGAAAGADHQAESWAPTARLELGLGQTGRPWRVCLAGVATAPHEEVVPPGRARWWRAAAAVGAFYEVFERPHAAVELGGLALLGAVFVTGRGFVQNETSQSLDFGGEAWLRVVGKTEGKTRAIRFWAGCALAGWARRQALDVADATTSPAATYLPRWGVTLALGVARAW